MEPKIDWQAALNGSRPVTTRDGRKVTLYCVDASGDWPVHGRIGEEPLPNAWRLTGKIHHSRHVRVCRTPRVRPHPPRSGRPNGGNANSMSKVSRTRRFLFGCSHRLCVDRM